MSEPTLYEAAYILDPSLSDEETDEVIAAIEAAAEEAGAEVIATRDFRTRRLAYEIDGFTHGNYRLLYFNAASDEQVAEIRSEMTMRQAVIRARVFVANPDAMIGGGEEAEEEADEAAEVDEAAEAAEAAEEAEATEEPVAEEDVEAEGDEMADDEEAPETDEAVEADEAPETEQ